MKNTLQRQMSGITFRKSELTVPYLFYTDEYGEEYTTTEIDKINYQVVCNAYREKNSIPFTDEIISLRKRYNLTTKKMSLLLGFGENQYRLYENGDIPTLSNAKMISGIEDIDFFERLVNEAGDLFSEKEKKKLQKRIEEIRTSSKDKKNSIIYQSYSKSKNRFNGYTSLLPQKLEQLIVFFAEKLNGVFETKLNKLLFYVDFLHYKHFAKGISGLSYKAITYGPVPVDYGTLYESFNGLHKDIIEMNNGYTGSVIYADKTFEPGLFSEDELSTMQCVIEHFKDISSVDISQTSHKEKAWLKNRETRSIIDYSDAFELNID